jgi:hypothetical protein
MALEVQDMPRSQSTWEYITSFAGAFSLAAISDEHSSRNPRPTRSVPDSGLRSSDSNDLQPPKKYSPRYVTDDNGAKSNSRSEEHLARKPLSTRVIRNNGPRSSASSAEQPPRNDSPTCVICDICVRLMVRSDTQATRNLLGMRATAASGVRSTVVSDEQYAKKFGSTIVTPLKADKLTRSRRAQPLQKSWPISVAEDIPTRSIAARFGQSDMNPRTDEGIQSPLIDKLTRRPHTACARLWTLASESDARPSTRTVSERARYRCAHSSATPTRCPVAAGRRMSRSGEIADAEHRGSPSPDTSSRVVIALMGISIPQILYHVSFGIEHLCRLLAVKPIVTFDSLSCLNFLCEKRAEIQRMQQQLTACKHGKKTHTQFHTKVTNQSRAIKSMALHSGQFDVPAALPSLPAEGALPPPAFAAAAVTCC